MLTGIYKAYGARVADVFTAFHSEDFAGRVTLPRIGKVPRNVAAICTWTWECAPSPRGPNIHANPAGYGVIARTFLLPTAEPAGLHPARVSRTALRPG